MKTVALPASLRQEMKKALDEKRFDHSLGVAYTCATLVFVHGGDIGQALTAGMLHDCAKCLSHEEKTALCRENGISISPSEEASPGLLHAKAGAYLAQHKYGVTDPEILDAIRCHTTGRPAMSHLDKLLYVADYIEPNRKMLPHLDEVRREAYRDLDHCVLMILEHTMIYLKEKAKVLDPVTQETLAYYREQAAQSKTEEECNGRSDLR